MPMEIIFHKVDSLTGNGVSHNRDGLFDNGSSKRTSLNDLIKVVAVNFFDVPPEGLPFGP